MCAGVVVVVMGLWVVMMRMIRRVRSCTFASHQPSCCCCCRSRRVLVPPVPNVLRGETRRRCSPSLGCCLSAVANALSAAHALGNWHNAVSGQPAQTTGGKRKHQNQTSGGCGKSSGPGLSNHWDIKEEM